VPSSANVVLYNPETDCYFIAGVWVPAANAVIAAPPPLAPLKLRMAKARRPRLPLVTNYTD